MSAKQELFDRLEYLDAAVRLPELSDVGIAISTHNGVANLLRKGLGIVAFNILEDYLKNRTEEALNFVSDSQIQFDKLTESLQDASISGTLEALGVRYKLMKKAGEDWRGLIQEESLKIHSTKQAVYQLSKYSFFSTGSNIGDREVTLMLKAFGIDGGWTSLKSVSDKIGGGLPDLAQAYKNAANRRHGSAHSAGFKYQYQWLSNIKNEILAIAASLDIILAARCRNISSNLNDAIDSNNVLPNLKFRFLEEVAGKFRETVTINGKAKKVWPDLMGATNFLRPLLLGKSEFLVVLNDTKRIQDWYVS